MAAYPPHLTPEQLEQLHTLAQDWASSHGLVVGAPNSAPNRLTQAPYALLPTPFPRGCFEEARALQKLFNQLVDRVSRDDAFIRNVLDQVAQVDEFTGRLYDVYKQIHAEGQTQQSITLGLHRADYLLHLPAGEERASIRQVEINTISASFGALASRTGHLHRYMHTRHCYVLIPGRLYGSPNCPALPENEAHAGYARGLAAAHKLMAIPNSYVLIVVQEGERNRFDQRWIEYALWEQHRVPMIRRTMDELNERATLDADTKALRIDGLDISVVYYRAGYGPEDYHSAKAGKDGGSHILPSRAVKCPSIAYQLVGAKKMQQVLAEPGALERFFPESPEACRRMRASFAGMYPLDGSAEGEKAAAAALATPDDYVMKPQREGGGNNVYGRDIPPLLASLSTAERSAYILMDLIRPPLMHNWLVRDGAYVKAGVVSELGIYGIWLSQNGSAVVNDEVGHLLRTKSEEVQEGGVATGFAVIDSPLLVGDGVFCDWVRNS
ncbi:glutathione synthase [Thamnocephalis sphaerospora]|uniref:Glutathione synthetase n=1 Tax=Thamnocephalis sphaerospora TaxID=78915 RepID=A0A4P9XUI5_9FUNG|nr:glutathione synthase [Thamnocephalis sphaerospora]|eukprot:RKP09100.1 glutathione synthase [Thamnocephalis sphaerospora]